MLTSSDGQAFSVAANATRSGAGRQVVSFEARQTRYVRIQSVQRATQYGISFWEVEVHGPADGVDPGPGHAIRAESSDPGPTDPGSSDGDTADDAQGAVIGPVKGLRGGASKQTGSSPRPATGAKPRSVLRLSLRLRRSSRTALLASGRTLASVGGGTVRLRVQRLVHGRWSSVRVVRAMVRHGSFKRRLAKLPRGRYRVTAAYQPPGGATAPEPATKTLALPAR